MRSIIQLTEQIFSSKVQDAFVVWFCNSRKFIIFEEPAFFVLKQLLKNKTPEAVSIECFKRYQNPIDICQIFVSEVLQITQQYIKAKENDIFEDTDSFNQINLHIDYYSVKNYKIGNSVFKINYGDLGVEEVIHPLISHLEENKNVKPCHQFDIFRNSVKLFFKVDGNILETFGLDETGYLKAAVLLKLLEILYGIRKDEWMMTMHAAAVTDGNNAVVFPAIAGSGKSTLATLLHAHGFNLLTDDFLAMDFTHKRIYQLPVAVTIKEGSVDVLAPYYPSLKDLTPEKAYTGKQVRYLPLINSFQPNNGYLAKHFVFITYLPGSPCTFKTVSKKEAIQALLNETWINPVPATVIEFFKWFNKTKFFELKYSETSDAIKVVSKLFKQ